MLRITFSSLILSSTLLLTGCDPSANSGDPAVNVSTTGGTPSCCEEPAPSLADARKAAMAKKNEGEEASKTLAAPTILGSKEADDAKALAEARQA